MDVKETELLRGDASDHWYYRSKAHAVEQLLFGLQTGVVLDVGAGSGFFSRYLIDRGLAGEAWCVDTNYPEESDIVENGRNIHFRRSISGLSADLILMMDVLEHVDDDVGLLRAAALNAAPDATFLISVPAFQFMWSGHDVFLEHKRRYTLRGIERVVKNAGWRVQRGCYFYASIFPAAMAVRLTRNLLSGARRPTSDLRTYPNFVNSALNMILSAESHVAGINRLFGLTAFVVATRA